MHSQQLAKHLEQSLAALYVIHGDEPLLVIEAADAVRAAAQRQGFDEREVLVVTPQFRWDTLFTTAASRSLFGGNVLIDLRMPTARPGREGAEALKRYCTALPADTLTIISLPQIDWATKKSAWFVALEKTAQVVTCDAPPLAQLPAWIGLRLARQGQSAPQRALELVAALVEGNLLAAHQEILKLGLLYPQGEISQEAVEAAVLNVARFDMEGLRQALAANDTQRCMRVLEGLRGEDAPVPLILWTLSHDIRQRAQRQSAQRNRARSALMRAARIDRALKGVGPGDVWDELQTLVIHVTAGTR